MAVPLPNISVKEMNHETYMEFKRKFFNFFIIHKVKSTDRELKIAYLKSAVDGEIFVTKKQCCARSI